MNLRMNRFLLFVSLMMALPALADEAQIRRSIEAKLPGIKVEGIQPALESSHAVAYAVVLARRMPRSGSVLVNLSGRGDKDMGILMEREGYAG